MPIHQIASAEHRDQDYPINLSVLKVLEEAERRHFWHRSRNRWILRALHECAVLPPSTFLDVGCGSGAVSAALCQRGYRTVGVDSSWQRIESAAKRSPEGEFAVGRVEDLPAELAGPYDAIGCFDVLEHLDDPVQLVRDAVAHGRPGAVFVATVPACGELFTAIDTLSGHKRRYELGQLTELFRTAGIIPVGEYGIFRSTVMLQRAVRSSSTAAPALGTEEAEQLMIEALRVPFAPINAALNGLCWLEHKLLWPWAQARRGASLLALARIP